MQVTIRKPIDAAMARQSQSAPSSAKNPTKAMTGDVAVSDFATRDAAELYRHLAADRNCIAEYLDYAKVVQSADDLIAHAHKSIGAGMVVKTIRYKGDPVGMSEIKITGDEVDLVRSWNAHSVRSKNIMGNYFHQAGELFRAQGKRAIIGSIREDNAPSNAWAKNVGGKLIRRYTNAEGTFNVYRHALAPIEHAKPIHRSKL